MFSLSVYMIWQAGAASLDIKVEIFANLSSSGSVPSTLEALPHDLFNVTSSCITALSYLCNVMWFYLFNYLSSCKALLIHFEIILN